MEKIGLCTVCAMFLLSVPYLSGQNKADGHQQVITDSLVNDFSSVVARNFSRYRTINMYWEMKSAHDFVFTADGKEIGNGRKRDLHNIRFSTMIPVLRKRQFSLYANVQYTSYVFDTTEEPYAIFSEHSYNLYSGGIYASYFTTLFNRPLVLSADISADGWDSGWGMLQGRLVAALVLARGKQSGVTLGIAGMTLGKIPVLPVISYWCRFSNPDWSVNATLPSQLYLRYQHGTQRVSVGCSMSGDNFYLRTNLPDSPSVCYYSEAVLKPEILYEYIINRHFYLSARAGISTAIKGALYTKSRKELDVEIEQKRSPIPFFNVGVSYSLFK